jgi:hypothetical protein
MQMGYKNCKKYYIGANPILLAERGPARGFRAPQSLRFGGAGGNLVCKPPLSYTTGLEFWTSPGWFRGVSA